MGNGDSGWDFGGWASKYGVYLRVAPGEAGDRKTSRKDEDALTRSHSLAGGYALRGRSRAGWEDGGCIEPAWVITSKEKKIGHGEWVITSMNREERGRGMKGCSRSDSFFGAEFNPKKGNPAIETTIIRAAPRKGNRNSFSRLSRGRDCLSKKGSALDGARFSPQKEQSARMNAGARVGNSRDGRRLRRDEHKRWKGNDEERLGHMKFASEQKNITL